MKGIVKLLKLLMLLSVLLAGVVFCLKNQNEVIIYFFNISKVPFPMYMVLLGAFFSGVFLTSLYGIVEFLSMSNRIRILKKKLKKNDQELQYLRTMPLEGDSIEGIKEESDSTSTLIKESEPKESSPVES